MSLTNEQLEETITKAQVVMIIGRISADLAARAGAWDGNAPDWFPEPPEWLELLERYMNEIVEEDKEREDFFDQYPMLPTAPIVDIENVDKDCGCG